MSLMETGRTAQRIVRSAIYLALGFVVACISRPARRFYPGAAEGRWQVAQYDPPHDGMNLAIHVSLAGGAILASPSSSSSVAVHCAGLYKKEQRFVIPFMAATWIVSGRAYFGYYWVLPSAMHILLDVLATSLRP